MGVLRAKVGGVWTDIIGGSGPPGAKGDTGAQGPAGVQGAPGAQGPIGPDEVIISPDQPTDPVVDFWYDTDGVGVPFGVPAGGTPGQVLRKKSSTDQDTQWADELPPNVAWGLMASTGSNTPVSCPVNTITYLTTAIAITLRAGRTYRLSWAFRAVGRTDNSASPVVVNMTLYDGALTLPGGTWIDYWYQAGLQWTNVSGFSYVAGDGVARSLRLATGSATAPAGALTIYPSWFGIEDVGPTARTLP